MTPAEQIEFFFAPPVPEQTGEAKSTLHLNRREVQDCLIGTVIPEGDVVTPSRTLHRLFASTMVIAAGVDLLAKFASGTDARGGVTERFISFAKTFMFPRRPNAETLAEVLYYGCRNPMLHSFNLHNDRYVMSLVERVGSEPIWRVREADGTLTDAYMVNVTGLYTAYVATIGCYKAALAADATLQSNFEKMFANHGLIEVRSATVTPVKPSRPTA